MSKTLMQQILESYYKNDAEKLHKMVRKILRRLGFCSFIDYEDFYSLANEVFADTIQKYDETQSFDGFLYSCLSKRFKSEMTRQNRQKRQADRMALSMEIPVGGEEVSTLGETIPHPSDVEKEVFEKREEGYSGRMLLYLSKLSSLQREVLRLGAAGYQPNEIKEELHMDEKEYTNCYAAIHSCRNVSILL